MQPGVRVAADHGQRRHGQPAGAPVGEGEQVGEALKRDAVVHQYVDESIIGGIILRVQDKLIDASVGKPLPGVEIKIAEPDAAGIGEVIARGANVMLGYYRNELPGNWKLYHENLKDPYHATLLHSFLVVFGLLVAGGIALDRLSR